MSQITRSYELLTERVVGWAQTQHDIRAIIVIGSQARDDRPADEWADLDVIVVTTDPERYLSKTDWLENVGHPWITFLEKTGTGDERERRVLFEGGLDVDFAIIPKKRVQQLVQLLRIRKRLPRLLRLIPEEKVQQITQGIAGFSDVARRGMRVLLDKDEIASHLKQVTAETTAPRPPTENEFLEAINDFWYHAVWTAKKLRRGELWVAKSCCDIYMKRLLLRMIEWHTRATHGWDHDTWHSGRFLEQWADARVVEGLRVSFARYDRDDVRRALLETMNLFRWLAVETAGQLSYACPTPPDERATELVKALVAEETRTDSRARQAIAAFAARLRSLLNRT
jgi:aminoglycoside 6-adenylyltransferase